MSTLKKLQAERVWRICLGAAVALWDRTAPNVGYATATAELLFGTAVQESGCEWERQRSPTWEGNAGGFSKWQVETGSIEASLAMLKRRPGLAGRCAQFVFADPHAPDDALTRMSLDAILWALRCDDNDKLGVMFSRLHYFRVGDPIPQDLHEQAVYWKQYYNTAAGKGTVAQYEANWMEASRLVIVG